MHRDPALFDDHLSKLDASLRAGDTEMARLHLAAFDLVLSGYVRGEERVLFPSLEHASAPVARMRQEHGSLRELVVRIWEALDRDDRRRSLDVLGTLRSVLLLHVTKEEWLYTRASW